MDRRLTNAVVVVFGLVAILAASSALNGDVIVLKDGLNGYTGTHDTYLRDGLSFQDNNYGGANSMEVIWRNNERDSIIRFDLPTLPCPAVITSAKLHLYYWDDLYMTSTEYLDVAVYALRRSWTEGSGDGQGGDERSGASWLYRHAHPDQTTWGNGGAHNVPNDRDGTYDDEVRIYGDAYDYKTWEGQEVTNTVAEWYAGTKANNGWVVDFTGGNEDTQGVYFYTSEYVSPSFRPKLEIHYEIVPEPATMGLVGLGFLASFLSRRRSRGKQR